MKNRIAGYIRKSDPFASDNGPVLKEAGKDPGETAPKHGDVCGFCKKSIEKTPFCARTYETHPHPTAICIACIERFAIQAQFARNFAIWYENKPNYGTLKQRILRRIAGEGGSNALKYTVVELAMRMVKRQSAKMADVVDAVCQKTGVSLIGTERIAIIGEDSQYCATLLPVIFKELGMFFLGTDREDLASGEAFKKLTSEVANGETGWSRYGVLYCLGYAEPNTLSSVIYAGRYSSEFPSDVEKIFIKEGK